MVTLSLFTVVDYIHSKHGYTPRIYLYHSPLKMNTKLSFVDFSISLGSVLEEYPKICFTHNNTQYIEEEAATLR